MTALASDMIVGGQDNTAAPTAAPAAPTFMPVGFPQTPAAFDEQPAVQARARIQELVSDKEFGKRLLAKDEAAMREWAELHRIGHPAPTAVASQADVDSQAAARNEQQFNTFFAWLEPRVSLNAEQRAEIRNGVIDADLHRWSVEELGRLNRDKAWYRRYLDGDRQASQEFELLKLMRGLRPARRA